MRKDASHIRCESARRTTLEKEDGNGRETRMRDFMCGFKKSGGAWLGPGGGGVQSINLY